MVAKKNNKSDTRTLTFNGDNVQVSGPSILCLSPFGGGSEFFSSVGPVGSAIQWTSSSSNGVPLSISSPSSSSTSVSGFTAGVFYSVNATYTCPGGASRTGGVSFIALSNTDPACGTFLNVGPSSPDKPTSTTTTVTRDKPEQDFGKSKLEHQEKETFSIYPNPLSATDALNIHVPPALFQDNVNNIELSITDLGGRIIHRATITSTYDKIFLPNHLAGGYYTVRVNSKNGVMALPLVLLAN